MVFLIAGLVTLSVGLTGYVALQMVPNRPASVSRRLAELEHLSANPFGVAQVRERQSRREKWTGILEELGQRVQQKDAEASTVRAMLIQAGYRSPNAVSVYWGVRIALPLALMAIAAVLFAPGGAKGLVMAPFFALPGWVAPTFFLGSRMRRRQHELRKALPDALDSLVVCVEAGLGLNQAIMRVAEEMRHISVLMSEELAMVNLEIRAGMPRDEALRSLADRTGLDDLRSLVGMLIQTERFGTSIAQALRVHADSLRTKRRQRAEEIAAKMSVKMLFPLVLCIMPALLIIIMGPAILKIMKAITVLG
jgi:tight adherence protein C